ncbi:GNAT family N-acetyltransferase [Streptomyces sp. NPDC026092]|uniref:GNAT family N-acetyltransferase n=1 Tax=Streptomyces sp. NPDC026092 TaxID=3154797 RepID=UPI0033F1BF0B
MPIRSALPEDAAAIAAVHVRSWQAAYRDLLPRAYLDSLDVDERAAVWAARLAEPQAPGVLVAAEDGAAGQVVGFCCFRAWPGEERDAGTAEGPGEGPDAGTDDRLDPATTGEIAALYVVPEVWGSGVGRGLLAASEEALVVDGFQDAALWVLADNARGRRFYEAAGWRPDGTVVQDTTAGRALDELRYRRRLFA